MELITRTFIYAISLTVCIALALTNFTYAADKEKSESSEMEVMQEQATDEVMTKKEKMKQKKMKSHEVDINTASAKELAKKLKGIGKTKAKAIVDYREENGPFTSVEQLLKVKGVGAATIKKNKDNIIISESK